MTSDNRKCPSFISIKSHWTEENQEDQECMDLFEWLFLLIYMKKTPLPIFGIVFVSQTTINPLMFYITYDSLYFENIQVI